MDLHAWITQQVDVVEASALAEVGGRCVIVQTHDGSHTIAGVITEAATTPGGMQLSVAQLGVESRDGVPAPIQPVTAILQRCEADRRILARHAPQPNGTDFDDGWQCRTCSVDGGDGYQYLVPYPCPTVEDLAHAHGVTPDVLAGLDHPRPPSYPTPPINTSDVPAALRGPRWKS